MFSPCLTPDSDGVVKVVDLRDELFGEVFEPLKDAVTFRAVTINPDTNTIEWPNGANFAPEFLYRIGKTVAAESAAAQEQAAIRLASCPAFPLHFRQGSSHPSVHRGRPPGRAVPRRDGAGIVVVVSLTRFPGHQLRQILRPPTPRGGFLRDTGETAVPAAPTSRSTETTFVSALPCCLLLAASAPTERDGRVAEQRGDGGPTGRGSGRGGEGPKSTWETTSQKFREEWWGTIGGMLFGGIGDLEEVELPEVPVDRVQPALAVLPEEGCQVGVGDEVAADREVGGHRTVDLKEPLLLREHAHARQAEEGLDVAEGIVGREGSGENSRMCGDAEKGNQRGLGDAEQVWVRGALLQEADGLRMLGAGRVRSVEEDVHVDRIAHSSPRSRTP